MKATEDEIAALIEQLRDDGMAAYHVHDHVGQQLGIIGAPALSPLLRAMQDPDASVRQGAAQALGRIGGPETVAALMVALADPSDDVRQESALTLGGLGDPSAGQALAAALEDDEPLVREAAAVSLGSLGGTGGVDALVRTLADESADVASAAAFSLCRLGWPGAVETILTLSQRNPEEDEGYGFGDYGFFDEALSALTEAGTSAVPACLAALSHENLMVRRVAIKVLGGSSDPRAVEPLMACLTDADPAVRAGGADALAQMGLPEVVDALLAALDASNDKLRLMAVEVLGQSGDERAIEPLHALKSEEGTPLARAVVEAVGRLVPPDIETLIAALKDPKEAVRRDAAQALAWRGDVRAAGPLLDALDDPATRCWATCGKRGPSSHSADFSRKVSGTSDAPPPSPCGRSEMFAARRCFSRRWKTRNLRCGSTRPWRSVVCRSRAPSSRCSASCGTTRTAASAAGPPAPSGPSAPPPRAPTCGRPGLIETSTSFGRPRTHWNASAMRPCAPPPRLKRMMRRHP